MYYVVFGTLFNSLWPFTYNTSSISYMLDTNWTLCHLLKIYALKKTKKNRAIVSLGLIRAFYHSTSTISIILYEIPITVPPFSLSIMINGSPVCHFIVPLTLAPFSPQLMHKLLHLIIHHIHLGLHPKPG